MRHFPPGQFARYVVVGLVNTAFGYGVYAGLTALFTPYVPMPYVFAFMTAYFVNITFSFLTYKLFIFKTKGNYLREWWRCIVVYGGTNILAVLFLPACVYLLQRFTPSAPYIAGALQMAVVAVAGFVGHKNFSFRADKHGQLMEP
jgi:putative flippase GtrA